MAHSRRWSLLAGRFGILGMLMAPAGAAMAEPIVLTLTPESVYTTGCFPPCLCPIQFVEGMGGTLTFRLSDSNPLFSFYDVDAALTVPGDPPRSLQGSGTYKVGGEVAIQQELVLDLSADGAPAQKFQSGSVAGGGEFPDAFGISVAIGERKCFDTVLEIRAKRTEPQTSAFVRGDCNVDGQVDLSDAVKGLLFLFGGGEKPACADACDANDDGKQDISDAVATLSSLFLGSGPLPPPVEACGQDPTADDIACDSFGPCSGSCEAEIAAIARETQIVGSCSAVVRLDYLSRRILGWQLICGKYAQVTEDAAREQAKADTGYGAGQMLNPADARDAFLFYEPPGDFGGAGVVSARTGLSLFGGSIVWLGAGDITYPKEWRPAGSLGVDCKPFEGDIEARGYDLVAGNADVSAETMAAALDVVRQTAVFDGMATSGYLFDATVILYPRTVGSFDPATAEWIVIVNGGWLE